MAESKAAAAKSGLEGVTAADSSIGKIDGVKGELRYRGYLITDLAKHSDYVETVHLLFHAELPQKAQYEETRETLDRSRGLDEAIRVFAEHLGRVDSGR